MTQGEFAKLLGMSQPTICTWGKNGWLVRDADGGIDAEASKAMILAARGSLKRMSHTQASKRSPWRRGPHCRSTDAWKSFRKLHGGGE